MNRAGALLDPSRSTASAHVRQEGRQIGNCDPVELLLVGLAGLVHMEHLERLEPLGQALELHRDLRDEKVPLR